MFDESWEVQHPYVIPTDLERRFATVNRSFRRLVTVTGDCATVVHQRTKASSNLFTFFTSHHGRTPTVHWWQLAVDRRHCEIVQSFGVCRQTRVQVRFKTTFVLVFFNFYGSWSFASRVQQRSASCVFARESRGMCCACERTQQYMT